MSLSGNRVPSITMDSYHAGVCVDEISFARDTTQLRTVSTCEVQEEIPTAL